MNRRPFVLVLLASMALGLSGQPAPAAAATIYECSGADGRAVFQDTPCRREQHQRVLQLSDVPTVSPAPSAPAPATPASAATTTPKPAPQPVAPLPVMYACVRATDGETYLSASGTPAPYLAPYGVLGAEQRPLSEVYGPDRGGAGISAPEANRGRISSALVANNYVWVQDQCRELDPSETCQALQDAYDQNEHRLRNAFQSQRPPLEQREAQLRAQLAGCGGG